MSESTETVKKYWKKPEPVDYMSVGKLPPQAPEFEDAVIGALMLEDCMDEVLVILKPEHFYKQTNTLIFKSMVQLYQSHSPIDQLTVVQQLRKNGDLDKVGGAFSITQLASNMGSSANVEYHSRVIKEMWVKRAVIASNTKILSMAYDDTSDPMELLDEADREIVAISSEVNSMNTKDYRSVVIRQVDDIVYDALNQTERKEVLGLPTGIYALDRKILGFNQPDMIIGAARPGEGKTSFSLQAANAILEQGRPVGIISLEMPMEQLNLKLLSLNTGISVDRLRKAKLNREEVNKLQEAKEKMARYPLHVYDKPCDPDMAKSIFKTWKKKHGIEFGIVDYVQRLKTPKYLKTSNSDAIITVASNTMKDICLTLEIPMLVLSQMSREVETRKSRPQLTDLRGSGSLEQDADIVIFIFRPEMHKIDKYEDGTSTKGVTEFIVEKSRLSSTGTIRARFNGALNRFDDSEFGAFNKESIGSDASQLKLVDSDDLPF